MLIILVVIGLQFMLNTTLYRRIMHLIDYFFCKCKNKNYFRTIESDIFYKKGHFNQTKQPNYEQTTTPKNNNRFKVF